MTSTSGSPQQEVASATGLQQSPANLDSGIARWSAELQRITRHSGRTALLADLFDLQLKRPEVLACTAVVRGKDGALALGPHKSKGICFDEASIEKWLVTVCQQAFAEDQTKFAEATGRDIAAVCTPIRVGNIAALVTLLKHQNDPKRRVTEIVISQLFAAHFSRWTDQQRMAQMTDELSRMAASVELVQRVLATEGTKAGCLTMAATLQDHLRCQRVVVGLKDRGPSCRVVAVSGSAEVDQHSATTRQVKAVLDECLVRDQLSAWPPQPGKRTDQLLAHRQLARRDSCVISTPLKTLDGETVGALTIVGFGELASMPQVTRFVDSLGEPLGSSLSALQRAEGPWLWRVARGVLAPRHAVKRWALAAMLLILAAVMITPVPYRVACRCVIEPVERRFCVAPHDGLLENTFAERGDAVQQGHLLARMDGREMRWELAGITADMSRAAKKRDMHMAHHETSDALMADLEMKRLDSRSKLLRYRQQNLEITSPIDGVVLSGSVERRENYPVSKGQVLYEVAPLNPLRVELSVPADDITRVSPGMLVELMFEGLGGRVGEGRLDKIRPRSEIRDSKNVFVAELVVQNESQQLRPGMKGRAKIVGSRRAIGWIVFHRAWEKAQTMWPW